MICSRAVRLFTVLALTSLACQGDPPPPVDKGRQPLDMPCLGNDPDCVDTAHDAAAGESVHTRRALLELLVARQYSKRAGGTNARLDSALRETIAVECGIGSPGMQERWEVIQHAEIDDLYPPEALKTAVHVGCGFLHAADGTTTRGKRVSWSP